MISFWLLNKKTCFVFSLTLSRCLPLSLWSSVLPGARWTPAVPLPVFRRGPEQLCNKYRCSRDSSDRLTFNSESEKKAREEWKPVFYEQQVPTWTTSQPVWATKATPTWSTVTLKAAMTPLRSRLSLLTTSSQRWVTFTICKNLLPAEPHCCYQTK